MSALIISAFLVVSGAALSLLWAPPLSALLFESRYAAAEAALSRAGGANTNVAFGTPHVPTIAYEISKLGWLKNKSWGTHSVQPIRIGPVEISSKCWVHLSAYDKGQGVDNEQDDVLLRVAHEAAHCDGGAREPKGEAARQIPAEFLTAWIARSGKSKELDTIFAAYGINPKEPWALLEEMQADARAIEELLIRGQAPMESLAQLWAFRELSVVEEDAHATSQVSWEALAATEGRRGFESGERQALLSKAFATEIARRGWLGAFHEVELSGRKIEEESGLAFGRWGLAAGPVAVYANALERGGCLSRRFEKAFRPEIVSAAKMSQRWQAQEKILGELGGGLFYCPEPALSAKK